MFRNAIVRSPSPSIINGLSTAGLGKPDYEKALGQHSEYLRILRSLGLKVRVLEANIQMPDSVFIEDVALCTKKCAVVTSPGAESRQPETNGLRQILQEYYVNVEEIRSPGTLEAGDVMMADNHFFIGISERTNIQGADQLINILENYGMTGSRVPVGEMLHLKSGISFLGNNTILAAGEFTDREEFASFKRICIDDDEKYAANSLWINGTVIVPAGFPETRDKIEKAGYPTIVTDVSEFRKVDGGLSCLSLRF
jgi:dimethylargininase